MYLSSSWQHILWTSWTPRILKALDKTSDEVHSAWNMLEAYSKVGQVYWNGGSIRKDKLGLVYRASKTKKGWYISPLRTTADVAEKGLKKVQKIASVSKLPEDKTHNGLPVELPVINVGSHLIGIRQISKNLTAWIDYFGGRQLIVAGVDLGQRFLSLLTSHGSS
jgi:hypothetical protein